MNIETTQPVQPLKSVGPDLYELTTPRRFWDDHTERCDECDGNVKEIRRTSTGVVVHLSMERINDLASDASYYDECGGEMDAYYFGLVSSARATLKRLAKFGIKG
jgi:hypothetical protein